MKVAVVGGGFAGLALAWHLLAKGAKADLYEETNIGAGASGVSSGLLHPYAGEQVRRSWQATEAIECTRSLLAEAQRFSDEPIFNACGILRKVLPKQLETFKKHAVLYQDVEILSEDLVRIVSGMTVHSSAYLSGLGRACLAKGMNLIKKRIFALSELEDYDAFILAVGSGIFAFPELKDLPLSKVKGQALLCRWPFPPLKESLLGKGHVVSLPKKDLVHLGATYERDFQESGPCMETALGLLAPQAAILVPGWTEIVPLDCRAGIRVVWSGHAVPLVYQTSEKGWALTGMGSRGLLYHAYYAKSVVEKII